MLDEGGAFNSNITGAYKPDHWHFELPMYVVQLELLTSSICFA
jgi:hypothetical protein